MTDWEEKLDDLKDKYSIFSIKWKKVFLKYKNSLRIMCKFVP